ncbi:MAG: NUDIX hydrolase [Candidatus Paceibacterota bacterium]
MKVNLSWISKTAKNKRSGYYKDSDDFSDLPQEKILAVCAFSFYGDKFVLVKNHGRWEPVAGHVEKGEGHVEALIREIKEESNMKVLKYFPLGYLYVEEKDFYQAQYLCLVEPYGPFINDPDGGVTEITLVDFSEVPKMLGPDDTSRATLKRCEEMFKKVRKQ